MRSRDIDPRRVRDVVAVVLAGGKGARLDPLTRHRAKPAVPFGGTYRIVDFALSNCLNSGLRRLLVLTQYKASSLDRHLNLGWHRFFCRELGEFLDVLPPQQRVDEHWYLGTADAVYQNIYSIEMADPRLVVVLAGDHIYKMNYQSLIEAHEEGGADVTVAALPVPRSTAVDFGTMEVDASGRVRAFREKVADPPAMPGQPGMALASMGIYCFSADFLLDALRRDAADGGSRHDFGHDILPKVIDRHAVQAFSFRDENRKRDAYWRDVGTIDAYFEANMDLVEVDPQLNLYDEQWPIRTHHPAYPPPKFVFAGEGPEARRGEATDSLVCPGAILSGGRVHRSIIGPGVRINSFARVEESIVCEGVDIGRHALVRRAIIDKGVQVPPHATVGVDHEQDAARGLTVSAEGVTVVPKGFLFPVASRGREPVPQTAS
ncbi:MAG: glucose-1-phosphate adenylyltransferase [Planctomycetia bacterium]|nr:glucose-1-phosphate adenylyltransferase [Planctomycetia bacterium]